MLQVPERDWQRSCHSVFGTQLSAQLLQKLDICLGVHLVAAMIFGDQIFPEELARQKLRAGECARAHQLMSTPSNTYCLKNRFSELIKALRPEVLETMSKKTAPPAFHPPMLTNTFKLGLCLFRSVSCMYCWTSVGAILATSYVVLLIRANAKLMCVHLVASMSVTLQAAHGRAVAQLCQ